VIIFSGPSGPKFNPEALVASENVGEGGPVDMFALLTLAETVSERKDLGPGIRVKVRMLAGKSSAGKERG
jgi:hypothetical protein